MSRHKTPGAVTRLLVLTVVLAFVAAACGSGDTGITQEQLDEVQAALDAKTTEVADLQAQLAEGPEIITIVQPGAPVEGTPVEPLPNDWATAESVRGGLHLVAEFDSSGPDAWDIAAHPKVYFTSESFEPANPAQNEEDPFFSGYHVIDAVTHEVVYTFTVGDSGIGYQAPLTRGPHGVGVSPDGKWMYVGWSETAEAEGSVTQNYVAIIEVRTGKINKLVKQESYFQFGMRGQAIHHIQCWTDVDGNDRCILQWGFGANGGPHHILDPNDDNRVVRSITYDDVKPMGHPFTTPSPDGKWVYVSMGANSLRESFAGATCVAKVSTDTPEVIELCDEHSRVLNHPIGITHTMDGKYTYVVDGSTSMVIKFDNEENEAVGATSAGVAGPYGICLNKDETLAFIVGKGEGSHNTGSVLGIIDTTRFSQLRADHEYPGDGTINPFYLGGSAASVDHCALNPDLDANEIWVSNMRGWETIVVNYATFEVTDYIPTPNGGDTHGMAFVYYNPDWTGELMSDMGGPKSKTLQAEIAALAAAAAAG